MQCFGDIANAIGGQFEAYLSVVAQVLQQAAGISTQQDGAGSMEMLDYVVSLREGIMDAWGGVIEAMRHDGKGKTESESMSRRTHADIGDAANLLQPYIESIFSLLHTVYQDVNRTEALLRSSMGVVGFVESPAHWHT